MFTAARHPEVARALAMWWITGHLGHVAEEDRAAVGKVVGVDERANILVDLARQALQRLDVDLDVEVARIADDRAVAHGLEMLLADDVLVARQGDEDVSNLAGVAHGHDAKAVHRRFQGADRLHLGGVKIYADGALGSRGAYLKLPYHDKPDTRGLQFLTDAQMLEQANAAASAGYQPAIHAIGDAANAQVISTYEKLARQHPGDRRWRIEHFQIVDPADIPRLKPAGIIASMQPTHQTSDRLMAEARLGPKRLAGAYAWQSVLKSGARLAFGTDFPVESPNPFPGLAAGISRQDMNGQPPGGWIASERLTLGEALHAYTRGAAYAGFAEDKIGSLEPGKYADFILVDRDPTAIEAQSLGKTQVLETWIAGKKVWSKASGAPERGQ